jgi:hypothetical protein
MTNEQQPADQGRGVGGALSCAFCGSAPAYHTTGGVWWSSHHIFYCPTVQCPAHRNVRGPPNASCGDGYSYRTREEALAAWNKREAAALSLPRQSEAVVVAWQFFDDGWHTCKSESHRANTAADGRWPMRPLYTTPQPAQADTTPAAHGVGDGMVVVRRGAVEMLLHKFERAGGPWKVATKGIELGSSSWASNVENSLLSLTESIQAASAPGGTTHEESK